MTQISHNLFIAGLKWYNYVRNDTSFVTLAFCQTIHYLENGWGYTKEERPRKDDPNYLISESSSLITVNVVDGPAHLYNDLGALGFARLLNWIDNHINDKKVAIICNQAISRSPSLAMLYCAKRGRFADPSFKTALETIIKIHPTYSPGGIIHYLRENWIEIQ